ncbi:MAG: energy-coupling factor ABC transporter permease [bacterium]|nr:energy-coupling factor ABC transporter permease [bacterium]
MHIPDGFLTVNTWLPAWLISIGGIGYCLRKATLTLKDKMIPLMGVMGAFVLCAQMVNFPVATGTSGHLLGGVLAAVLLGPYAGAVVITVVLVIQCFIFQAGGLTTLGANILNMSIIGTIGGYLIYNPIRKAWGGQKGIMLGVIISAWASIILAACACAFELAISGTSPLRIALPAMAYVHMLIGIVEAVITSLIIGFVLKVRPDLIYKI